MNLSAQDLIEFIQSIHKPSHSIWPIHEPQIGQAERHRINECLNSGYVSSVGQFVIAFEQALKEYTGANYAIATVNGTAALHIANLLAGVQPNDEVITSPLSFIATSNAIRYCSAFPHFVDIEPDTLGIDPEKLRSYLQRSTHYKNGVTVNKQTGRIIRALNLVHVLGHPAQLEEIHAICADYHLNLIEDAAESMGSTYKGQHAGTFGQVGVLSFNGNKVITTGGGGAILTNDEQLATRARHLTTTAKVSHPWEYYHDEIGYNYRMPNINAALGVAQLERLPLLLHRKQQLAQTYQAYFSKFSNVKCIQAPENVVSNYWLNALLLTDKFALNDFLHHASVANVGLRPLWRLHHTLPIFYDCPRMPICVAEDICERVICLPSSAHTFSTLEKSTCAV